MIKINFQQIKIYSCIAITIFSSFMPVNVLAMGNGFYSSNDVLFYDPNDTLCASINNSTGAIDASGAAVAAGVASLEKSDTLQQIYQLLINGGMNAVQASAVMGNIYAESEFNSNSVESNGIGYGLVQWSNTGGGNRRTELENYAAQKGVAPSDVAMQIEFLFKEYNSSYKTRLDKSDFNGTDIAKATEAWMIIFEAPKMQPANDPAALISKRIPAAQKIYEYYSSLQPEASAATTDPTVSSGGIISGGCISDSSISGNGVVAGNIAQTAINFALTVPATEGMNSKSDARDTFQVAKEQYNPAPAWSDCGGFVATVMIASGADPNYVNVSVVAQYAYVKAHPEKYLVIDNPTVSDLQPGDIMIKTGQAHTVIYTGAAGYPYVDASLSTAASNGRVPSVRTTNPSYMIDNGAIIARIIQ